MLIINLMSKKKLNFLFIYLISVALILGLFFVSKSKITDYPPHRNGDNGAYFLSAYNLKKFNIYSYQHHEFRVENHKNIIKPPLYSFGLSFFMKQTDVIQNNASCFFLGDYYNNNLCKNMIRNAKIFNVLIHLALSISIFLILFDLTRNIYIPFVGFYLIYFSNFFSSQINNFMTESLSSFLLLLHSYFLIKIFKSQSISIYHVVCSAIFLGLLILTKAIFLYWFYIIVTIFVLFYGLIQLKKFFYIYSLPYLHRYTLKKFLLFFFITFIIYVPWQVRNFMVDGRFEISSQSGNVIAERAEYLNYDIKKYHYAFVWYLPYSEFKKKILSKFDQSLFSKFDESHPSSFYRLSSDRDNGFILSKLNEKEKNNPGLLFKQSLKYILENPFKNIYLSIILIYRASFMSTISTDPLFTFINDFFTAASHWPSTFGLLFIFLLFLIKKNKNIFFIAPSIFGILSYGFLTDFESRYAAIFVPVFIVLILTLKKKYESFNYKN